MPHPHAYSACPWFTAHLIFVRIQDEVVVWTVWEVNKDFTKRTFRSSAGTLPLRFVILITDTWRVKRSIIIIIIIIIIKTRCPRQCWDVTLYWLLNLAKYIPLSHFSLQPIHYDLSPALLKCSKIILIIISRSVSVPVYTVSLRLSVSKRGYAAKIFVWSCHNSTAQRHCYCHTVTFQNNLST